MKIMFHCWEFPPNGTGVGVYFAAMSEALVQAGHQVIIATGQAEGYPENESGAHGEVHRFYSRSDAGSKPVATRVLELAQQAGVDWIEGADHLGEMAPLWARTDRPPIIVKSHNSRPLQVVQDAEILYPWQRILQRVALFRARKKVAAERYSLTHADILSTPCERLKQELVRQGLAREGKVLVIPNPIRMAEVVLAAPSPEKTILFAGRIAVGKGIGYLPVILKRVWEKHPDARLEIAGPDSYARGLGSLQYWLSRRFGSDLSRIKFLGPLASPALEEAYRRATVVIVPSRWDNFPNVILEAMVRGIPVVSSLNGGMPEMLEGTGCPLVHPDTSEFANSIINILDDENMRRECSRQVRKRALDIYHPAKIATLYIETISHALGYGG